MQVLGWFIPNELAVLLIAAAGLALIAGARRTALLLLAVTAAIALRPVIAPLGRELFDTLLPFAPWWIVAILGVIVFFWIIRMLLKIFLSTNASEHVEGHAFIAIFRWLARMLGAILAAPFRLIGRLLRQRRS